MANPIRKLAPTSVMFLILFLFGCGEERIQFSERFLVCRVTSGADYDRWANVDQIRINSSFLTLSIGDTFSSNELWTFDNREESIWVNFYSVHKFENGTIAGGGIRTDTPFAFEYAPNRAPGGGDQFTITRIDKGFPESFMYSCLN
jgi:hypothetical protein